MTDKPTVSKMETVALKHYNPQIKDTKYIIDGNGIGRITFGNPERERGTNQVDHLVTDTLTNTAWFVDKADWGCRQVSVSLDLDKAKGLIALLQKYVEFKEAEE